MTEEFGGPVSCCLAFALPTYLVTTLHAKHDMIRLPCISLFFQRLYSKLVLVNLWSLFPNMTTWTCVLLVGTAVGWYYLCSVVSPPISLWCFLRSWRRSKDLDSGMWVLVLCSSFMNVYLRHRSCYRSSTSLRSLPQVSWSGKASVW